MTEALKKLLAAALLLIGSSACSTNVDDAPLEGEHTGTSSSALSPGCTDGYHAAVGNLRLSARAGCNQKFILALHGGGWVSGSSADMDVLAAPMNAAGIVYASLEYTNGAPMQEILDQVAAAIASVRTNAVALGIDANRMGLIGFSAGGQLALEAGLIDGHMRWIGSFSGPPDMTALEISDCAKPEIAYICDAIHHVMGGTPSDSADRYRQYSPIDSVSRLVDNGVSAPTFYFGQGTSDNLVPVDQVDRMVMTLAGMGVRVAYDRVPGDHVSFIGGLIPRAIANAAAEMGAPSPPPAYGSGVPDNARFPIHRCVDPVTQNHRYVFAPGDCSLLKAVYEGVVFSAVKGGAGTVPVYLWRGAKYDYALTADQGLAFNLTLVAPLGAVYSGQTTGTSRVYLCMRDRDGNVVPSKSSACEGMPEFHVAAVLGYAF